MSQPATNYTVLIEKEKRSGTEDICYTAFVPVLGIATEADSLDEVEKEVQSLIKFHLESLVEEGEEVPIENASSFVARYQTVLPEGARVHPA